MPEPSKNGQSQPNPDTIVTMGPPDIIQMPNGSIQMKAFAVQKNMTVAALEVWGKNIDAIIIGLQLAWKSAQETKSGIVIPK